MKLLGILFGFMFAMTGLIITVHSSHYIVGLLLTFGGLYTTIMCLPGYKERLN